MPARFVRGNPTLANQIFDMTMVASPGDDVSATQMVDTTVTDVSPIRRSVLDYAHRAGSSRTLSNRQSHADGDDGHVRSAKSEVQKPKRIHQGQTSLQERVADRFDSGLSGQSTPLVATHSVRYDQAGNAVSDQNRRSILIFFPVPDQADVCVLVAQSTFHGPPSRPDC
jgi:hypothetical protein